MNGETTRARIRELVAGGAASLRQVAVELGVTPQTVHHHLQRMPDVNEVRAALAANKRVLTVHGETKPLTAWARDERCAVSLNTLKARLATGVWAIGAAIGSPAEASRPPRGIPLSNAQAREMADAADRVRSGPRVHRHTPPDAPEAVALRERNALIRAAIGRGTTIAEIARVAGLSWNQVDKICSAKQRLASTGENPHTHA